MSAFAPGKGYQVLSGGSGKISVYIDEGTSGGLLNFNGTDIADDLLHHIVINFDRDANATLYLDEIIDGTPQSIAIYDSTLNHFDNTSKLASNINGGNSVTATLDEFYFYKRLLKIDEIYNLRRNSSNYSQQIEGLKGKTIPIIY